MLKEDYLFIHDAIPFDVQLFSHDTAPGTVVDKVTSTKQFVVKTTDGSLLVRQFSGLSLEEISLGSQLDGGDYNLVLQRIRGNYPPDLPIEQQEV